MNSPSLEITLITYSAPAAEGKLPFLHLASLSVAKVCSLIAIMLGRLQMTVDDAIKGFKKYCRDIFSHPRLFGGPTTFALLLNRDKYDQKVFEQAMKDLVDEFNPDPGGHIWSHNLFAAPEDRCKT